MVNVFISKQRRRVPAVAKNVQPTVLGPLSSLAELYRLLFLQGWRAKESHVLFRDPLKILEHRILVDELEIIIIIIFTIIFTIIINICLIY